MLGQPLFDLLAWAKEGFKRSWAKVGFFEDIGLTYIGVLDGHDLPELEKAFEQALHLRGPVVVHVKTIKGKGYAPAEADSVSFHGASLPPIDLGLIDPTEEPLPVTSGSSRKPKTYTQTFVEELVRLAAQDERICAITAGMPTGTGLSRFGERFPRRFFDVGIAEEHSVTMAAGLAQISGEKQRGGGGGVPPVRLKWEDSRLAFVVREPFVSKHSGASIVAGMIEPRQELILESLMPADGVIFSDGIEADFLQFNSGTVARIRAAREKARLVVP